MSKSGLLLSPCLWWARPEAEYYREDIDEMSDNSKRDNGTLTHNNLDMVIKTGCHQLALPQEVACMVQHGCTYIYDHLLPSLSSVASEMAVAVNWLTGETKYLPGVTGREYPNLGYDWQCGTADVVGITHNGRLYVADWKTGTTEGSTEQLLSLAYGFSRLFNDTPPVVISCLSVNNDGVWPHEQEITKQRLDLHFMEMKSRWIEKDVPKYNDRPYPGAHCTALYCPHLAYCSAITDTTSSLATESDQKLSEKVHLPLTDRPVDDDHAGYVQAVCSAAKRRIDYYTNSNKKRVRDGVGRVTQAGMVWEDRGNGFRWHRG